MQGYLKQFPPKSKDFSCRFCLLSQELIISFDRKALPWKQVFCGDRPEKHSFLRGELYSPQFISVLSLSRVRLFETPWTAAHQISLSTTNSQSLHKLMSIESVKPSSHLILCHPFLLPPSIFPSVGVFWNKSVKKSQYSLHLQPKCAGPLSLSEPGFLRKLNDMWLEKMAYFQHGDLWHNICSHVGKRNFYFLINVKSFLKI